MRGAATVGEVAPHVRERLHPGVEGDDELEQALKMLQDAAAQRVANIDRLKNEAHALNKTAKAAQNELKRLMHEEQAALRAKAKAEMEAEEARIRKEEDDRAKKAEEAEAAKRRKAREKAAYDAKIAAKRSGH